MAFYDLRIGTVNPLTAADDIPGIPPDGVTTSYDLIGSQDEMADGSLVEDIVAYRPIYKITCEYLTHAQRERLEILRRTAGTLYFRDERGAGTLPVRFVGPIEFETVGVGVQDPSVGAEGRYFRYNTTFTIQYVTPAGPF